MPALAEACLAGGARFLQIRAKHTPSGALLQICEQVVAAARPAGAVVIVNDRADVAALAQAAGVHLGQDDLNPADARRILGGFAVVGISTHSLEQARAAARAPVDYIAVGPVFATGTKPTARPVTLEYVRWASANVNAPWFAIGGITLLNLDDVLAAGARRICVVSAILDAPDIVKTCRAFKDRLPSAP